MSDPFGTRNTYARDIACDYAERFGLSMFPCEPGGKKPLTRNGFHGASNKVEIVACLFDALDVDNPNIGAEVPAGHIVLDFDPRNGGTDEVLKQMVDDGLIPAVTWVHKTGGGGWHIFLKLPDGVTVDRLRGKLCDGVDIKLGERGYVLMPGSVHPCGGVYSQWHPDGTEIAEAPAALVDMLLKPAPTQRPPAPEAQQVTADHPYIASSVRNELDELATCPEGGGRWGGRNPHLNVAALSLAGWRELDRDWLRAKLIEAATVNGLVSDDGEASVNATISSAFRKADTEPPRTVPPKGDKLDGTTYDPGPALDGPPEDGAQLLDDIDAFLARFVVYPSDHYRHAHTLWIAHTWLMECWDSTPRIAFLSPEPGSGKSRALEVTEPLVPNPVHAVNTTPAYLFRKVADPAGKPTILYDEIDTVFGPRAKDNEDVRGMLNAGHRKGAVAGRCVVRGKNIETEELDAYCAVALAGLNDLPDTIRTRSVVVRMQRRAANEKVEPWRPRINGPDAALLRQRLQRWAAQVHGRAVDYWPEMPDGVADRVADVWESLISVADLAGDHWPATSRVAAVAAVADLREGEPTLGIQLLSDIRSYFSDHPEGRALTASLLTELRGKEGAPWAEIDLTARKMARWLANYGIKPKDIKHEGKAKKGYVQADFADAWNRYLPAVHSL